MPDLPDHRHRHRRRCAAAAALAAALVVGGCAPRVDAVPAAARNQAPRAAPNSPWQGQGRLEVSLPGKRISCTAILRGLGTGATRAVFLSDEGLQLADLTAEGGAYQTTRAIPDMDEALPQLGRLVAQAYATPAAEVRAWRDDRLVATSGDEERWYGGDPLLLRCVVGHHVDIYLEDYRPLGGELLPWEVRGEGPLGITIRLRLQSAKQSAKPAP